MHIKSEKKKKKKKKKDAIFYSPYSTFKKKKNIPNSNQYQINF